MVQGCIILEELNNNEMKQIIADIINQEKEENEERARKFREERARAREQAKNNRSSR